MSGSYVQCIIWYCGLSTPATSVQHGQVSDMDPEVPASRDQHQAERLDGAGNLNWFSIARVHINQGLIG